MSSVLYYVDEAGDCTLWDRRGRVIAGTEGCSRYFIMGLAHVRDQSSLTNSLEALRAELLADPYFKNVPSMRVESGRTAVFFHAKDDPSEVRREVFRVLLEQDIEFHAVVRDKLVVERTVSEFRRVVQPTYHYSENSFYDHMARRLMKDKLHGGLAYSVTFSRRGSADRTEALKQALETARDKWCRSRGITGGHPPVTVSAAWSNHSAEP